MFLDDTLVKLLDESQPLVVHPCLCSSVPNLTECSEKIHHKEAPSREKQIKPLVNHQQHSHQHQHHDHEHEHQHSHEVEIKNPKPVAIAAPEPAPPHSHSHSHSHSHMHGHSHSSFHIYKSSREKAHHDHHKKHEKEISDVKLIAWMVIMGDGLHNFSDGLAIGVSFASSLTIGFGTAIAVLCHELPHEIGDFAVLRRAGVTLKRALVFNAVSGVLALIGALVGLLIGSYQYLTNWSFLFIAGTFLYISLVDMVSVYYLFFCFFIT